MPVWPAPPVSDQPFVELHQWRVFKVPAEGVEGYTYHLVGYVDGREARVCSPIQSIDIPNLRFVTRSGRQYHLYGGMRETTPGSAGDAGYLFARWLQVNGIDEKDVVYVDSLDADSI